MSHIVTNEQAQAELTEALDILNAITDPNSKTTELEVAKMVLSVVKEHSNSANGIPTLRGLGLEDALKMAREVKAHGISNLRINTKALAKAIVEV